MKWLLKLIELQGEDITFNCNAKAEKCLERINKKSDQNQEVIWKNKQKPKPVHAKKEIKEIFGAVIREAGN